ncbi:hypothetical protein HRbin18_01924 [bacterium HR18]|nr:hypothetical protein HRbin18_01924 [bacterium HR18]
MSNLSTIYLSLNQPTGNFWVDMGLVVLLEHFGEGVQPISKVYRWLVSQLLQATGKKGEYFDQETGQICEYDKVNWVYPTNLFIKVAGSAPKKKIGGKDYFTQPPRFNLTLKLSKKAGFCDICGDKSPLTGATMWMYPFVVDPQKFGNFYPGTKRGFKLCARCALAGLAGYLGWLWKAQGRDALHFFIFHSELREMKRLHEEVLQPLQLKGNRGGSVPAAFSGPYIHETTLGLLLELFQHVHASDRLSPEACELLSTLLGGTTSTVPPAPITLYAVTGTPKKTFNMQALREFSKLQRLYWLYEQWVELIADKAIDENPHRRLARIFKQFQVQQRDSLESIWRDRVAWAVLEFGDPLPFVEEFLFEARAREENPKPLIGGTIDVLNHYVQEVLDMNEQFQRTLAGFGHSLGAAAREHNEMGLLYALRNAKNPEDFYRMLNDAQFRFEVTIPEALLRIDERHRIAGVPWVRVKTLLSIYALNTYLRKGAPQEEAPTTQEK